jgi:hypothetical protein
LPDVRRITLEVTPSYRLSWIEDGVLHEIHCGEADAVERIANKLAAWAELGVWPPIFTVDGKEVWDLGIVRSRVAILRARAEPRRIADTLECYGLG